MFSFFFFQAEDGIRDFHVTGVQTCALPISAAAEMRLGVPAELRARPAQFVSCARDPARHPRQSWRGPDRRPHRVGREIGRASCREKGYGRWGKEHIISRTHRNILALETRKQ